MYKNIWQTIKFAISLYQIITSSLNVVRFRQRYTTQTAHQNLKQRNNAMAEKNKKAEYFERVSFSLNSNTGSMTVAKLEAAQLLVANKTGKVHDRSTIIHHLLIEGAKKLCEDYGTSYNSL